MIAIYMMSIAVEMAVAMAVCPEGDGDCSFQGVAVRLPALLRRHRLRGAGEGAAPAERKPWGVEPWVVDDGW